MAPPQAGWSLTHRAASSRPSVIALNLLCAACVLLVPLESWLKTHFRKAGGLPLSQRLSPELKNKESS